MGKHKYEATIDELRALANHSMHGAVEDAGHAAHKMRALSHSGIHRTALSAIPSCVHFQDVLSDAMATYAEVVHGIKEDVAAFHKALHSTADTMQRNDESAAEAFTAIARKINGPLATERRGKHAYDKHRSLQDGKVEDAPRIPGVTDPDRTGSAGAQPSATTAAPPPPAQGNATSYDARTGNPQPSSSTSAGPPPG